MSKFTFVKMLRSPAAKNLRKHPNEFTLAAGIADRARRSNDVFSEHNLELGEALIGDYKSFGMTERKYRTAKKRLEKWGIATFKATNKGTIARLTDTRVFDINVTESDEQVDRQATNRRRTGDEQATTNKKLKKEKEEKETRAREESSPPAPPPSGEAARDLFKDFDEAESMRFVLRVCDSQWHYKRQGKRKEAIQILSKLDGDKAKLIFGQLWDEESQNRFFSLKANLE